jgi:hypothetical protein
MSFLIESLRPAVIKKSTFPIASKGVAVMDDVTLNGKVYPCVEVVEACGEWFVRVVEEDQELTRSFEIESFALAFAEGQRRRLGLERIIRL